jgi:hypothetical protein
VEGEPEQRGSVPQWAPAVAGALSILTFVDVVRRGASKIVSGDSAVLWYEAHEWGHLRWHAPAFFGQAYGSSLPGVPVALLHGMGMSYALALPVALAASTLAMWFALALAMYRRGHVATATVTAAMPALLSSYHDFYVAAVTFERAFVITGVGAALLLWPRQRPAIVTGAVALLGIGLYIDVSSVLLVVPIVAWWVLERRRVRAEWIAVAIGASLALVYAALSIAFYRVHRDYKLYLSPAFTPTRSIWDYSIGHLSGAFRMFAPEVLRAWWIPVTIAVVLTVALVATRRARYAIPALFVPLATAYALSTPRASSGAGFTFLPPARILLFLPPALCFLALLAARAYPGIAARVARPVTLLVVVVAAASFVLRVASGSHSATTLLDPATHASIYRFASTTDVEQRCAFVARYARAAHVDTIVVLNDPWTAMGCEARFGSSFRTLDAPYERRAWRLREFATRSSRAALFYPGLGLCDLAARRFTSCETRDVFAVVHYRPQPLLNVLALLDIPVRAFGSRCAVDAFWCRSGTDARRAFPRRVGAADGRLAAAVNAISRGDASYAEPGPQRTAVLPALEGRLRGRTIAVRDGFRSGPRTYAATLRVPTAHGRRDLLGQFVVLDGRVTVSESTLCALGTRLGVACAPGSPFGESVWRAQAPN